MKQSFFDIVDEHDQPLNIRAGYDEVHRKGLWHRGVHVIIHTPDKEIVMQKRAVTLNYHPDLIEISVGGGVDSGETTEQAIVREIHEELGITVSPAELHFVGKTKYNHPTKKLLSRNFIYSYSVCIDRQRLHMRINPEESSEAFLIPKRKLQRALLVHRIKNKGRISGEYAFWKYLLSSIN